MTGDDRNDEYADRITAAWAATMPEIRQQTAETRARIAAFFEIPIEALPAVQTAGYSRLLATYAWTVRPHPHEDLRHMLDRKIFEGRGG